MSQTLSAIDIIKGDLSRGGLTASEEKTINLLAKVIQEKSASLLRHGNTIGVLIRQKEPKTGSVHIYTVDSLPKVTEALKNFYETVKKSGFTKLIGETENPAIVTILKKIGIPLKVTKRDKKYYLEIEV